jgi:broad specificity phosphatase PhoE
MATRLILISHAATAAQRQGRFPDDDPPDARGIAEAIKSRTRLPVVRGARLLCSANPSAIGTAEALGSAWQSSAQAIDELNQTNFGEWRGRRIADVAAETPALLKAWSLDPTTRPPEGESFDELRRRVSRWMDALEDQATYIAISHACVIRAAVLHALDAPTCAFAHIEIPTLSTIEVRRSLRGWAWWPAENLTSRSERYVTASDTP